MSDEPIDFEARVAHIEMLRGWAKLAAAGHPGAAQVMAQPHVQEKLRAHQQRVGLYAHLPMAPPIAVAPPAPAVQQSAALTPQAPRVPVPVASPASAGISRRVDVLTSLLGTRPTAADPTTDDLV